MGAWSKYNQQIISVQTFPIPKQLEMRGGGMQCMHLRWPDAQKVHELGCYSGFKISSIYEELYNGLRRNDLYFQQTTDHGRVFCIPDGPSFISWHASYVIFAMCSLVIIRYNVYVLGD
jgi:hypothetical protein